MAIEVEDHVAIERLMYTYARCADRKDYPGFADVFCDDAVFDFMGRKVVGIVAIQEMMLNLEKYTLTQHRVHNVLYDVDGETATGETYCLASHLFATEEGERKIDMGITYDDQLRRTAAGWRIARRDFQLLWRQTTVLDAL